MLNSPGFKLRKLIDIERHAFGIRLGNSKVLESHVMVLLCYLYHFVSFRFCSDVFFYFLFTKLHLRNLAFFQKNYSWFSSVYILIIYNPLLRFCFSQPSVLNIMPHNMIFFALKVRAPFPWWVMLPLFCWAMRSTLFSTLPLIMTAVFKPWICPNHISMQTHKHATLDMSNA